MNRNLVATTEGKLQFEIERYFTDAIQISNEQARFEKFVNLFERINLNLHLQWLLNHREKYIKIQMLETIGSALIPLPVVAEIQVTK